MTNEYPSTVLPMIWQKQNVLNTFELKHYNVMTLLIARLNAKLTW